MTATREAGWARDDPRPWRLEQAIKRRASS
jgi:hypothetical protein